MDDTDIVTTAPIAGRQAKDCPPVQVVWIRDVPDAGRLKATCRIRVWNLTIDDIKILEAEPDTYWLGLPQKPVRRNADGTGSGWKNILEFDPTVWPQIREQVLAVYREHLASGGAA
jgi:hypothetical protein